MRHRVKKYGHFKKKDQAHRSAMLRNLVTSFFLHKSLITTEKRALAVVGEIDRLILVANSENKLNAIRDIGAFLFTKESAVELFEHVAPKFKGKTPGFSRITPIKYRTGDNAKLVKLELLDA